MTTYIALHIICALIALGSMLQEIVEDTDITFIDKTFVVFIILLTGPVCLGDEIRRQLSINTKRQ